MCRITISSVVVNSHVFELVSTKRKRWDQHGFLLTEEVCNGRNPGSTLQGNNYMVQLNLRTDRAERNCTWRPDALVSVIQPTGPYLTIYC